jgi:hypothetical protein
MNKLAKPKPFKEMTFVKSIHHFIPLEKISVINFSNGGNNGSSSNSNLSSNMTVKHKTQDEKTIFPFIYTNRHINCLNDGEKSSDVVTKRVKHVKESQLRILKLMK